MVNSPRTQSWFITSRRRQHWNVLGGGGMPRCPDSFPRASRTRLVVDRRRVLPKKAASPPSRLRPLLNGVHTSIHTVCRAVRRAHTRHPRCRLWRRGTSTTGGGDGGDGGGGVGVSSGRPNWGPSPPSTRRRSCDRRPPHLEEYASCQSSARATARRCVVGRLSGGGKGHINGRRGTAPVESA